MRILRTLRASLLAARPRGGALFLALLTGFFATGCGGGDGGTTPEGSFTIMLSSSVLTIVQGAEGGVTVTIARSGDFAGAVTITVTGLPAGVTAGALTIGAESTSGQLTLTAAGGATAGNANLTVQGSGTGVANRTAPLQLTVNSSTAPGFTLSLNPTSGTVQGGSDLQTTVSINRTGGFAGAVTLTATGLPAGVTASFNPTAPTGNTAILTLTAAGGAAASGPTQVTVQGAAAGPPNQTAQFALTVTAQGGGGGGNVTIDFCGLSGLPLWVAYQDGSGAWTRANGAGPSYSFTVNANTGAIAWVNDDGDGGFGLDLFYGTRAELIQFGGDRCDGEPGAGKTVTGTVAGLTPFSQLATFTLGRAQTTGTPTLALPGVTFTGVPNGPVDLLGGVAALDFVNFTLVPSRMYIQRNLNPGAGSSVGTIDLDGANSFDPEQRNLTITGVAGNETVLQTTILFTANGRALMASATGQNSWYGVPGARLVGNDLQILTVSATQLAALAPSRAVQRVIAAPTDLTLSLGPDLSDPTVVGIAATGYSRARATYPIQADYQRYWVAQFQQAAQGGNTARSSQIQMTSGYRGSTTGDAVLEVPDFAGVAGWMPTWGLRPGTVLTWNLNAIGWASPGGILQPVLSAGEVFRSASRFGQFTP